MTADTFSAYVAARQPALVRTAYLLTGDHHAAADLVRTTLAKTYLRWHRIRDLGAVDAHVRRTMMNEHLTWWRRCRRRAATSPEHTGGRDEMWELVETLPPLQRAAVVLRYYEDLSEAETAHALGCSLRRLESLTSRALARLRARSSKPMPSRAVEEQTA